jgi:hypothetical protein
VKNPVLLGLRSLRETAPKIKTAFHKLDVASHRKRGLTTESYSCEGCDKRFGNTAFWTDRSSGNQNRRAFETASSQIGQGLVGILERIAFGLGDDADLGHQAQKINTVLPSEISNRHELPFFP